MSLKPHNDFWEWLVFIFFATAIAATAVVFVTAIIVLLANAMGWWALIIPGVIALFMGAAWFCSGRWEAP